MSFFHSDNRYDKHKLGNYDHEAIVVSYYKLKQKNMMLIIMAVAVLSKENDNYDDGSDDIGKNESCRESAPPFLNSLNILSFSFQLSVF